MDQLVRFFGIIAVREVEGQFQTFLVHQRNGDFWGFPKGRPSKNESAVESAKREFLEETGMPVKTLLLDEPIIQTYEYKDREGKRFDKQVDYYVAEVEDNQPSVQHAEICDGKWLSFEKALQTLTYENSKEAFREMIQKLNEARG